MADMGVNQGTAAQAKTAPFVRKATGLVRELPLLDMVTYNAAVASPIGTALALSLFFAFAAFPGANLVVALIVAFIGVVITIFVFALLSSAMPRIGGDYAFISRIINPPLALASNFCYLAGALLAVAWIAVIGVKLVLAPSLAIVGTLNNDSNWINAANTVSQNGWAFAIGSLIVIATGAVAVAGTKLAGRVMSIFYLISLGGAVVTLAILAFTSHDTFVSHLNSFSQPFTHTADTYGATIAAGQKAGLVYPDQTGYSFWNTVGAIFITYGITVSSYAGCYLAGEMKGAGKRSRQLASMLIGGLGQGFLLVLSVIVFLNTMGLDFMAAASNGYYGVAVAPYSNFFVGVVAGNTALAIVLAVAFACAIPIWIYVNAAIVYRGPFAWAFDGLLPRALTVVNPRTHTPVVAITIVTVLCVAACAWAAFSVSFLTLFSYLVLLGFFTIIVVSIAAIVMPWRAPDIYRGSPAEWRVMGVQVLPVVGVLSVIWNVAMVALAVIFHTNIGLPNLVQPIGVLAGIAVAGVVFYYVARAVQQSRNVDVSLAFKAIPPE
jgi:APA family basic amino acid/polyamine antiporter